MSVNAPGALAPSLTEQRLGARRAATRDVACQLLDRLKKIR